MRALRRPRLWLAVWLGMVAMVIVLSLVPPPDMAMTLPKNSDKVEHLLAYAALAFAGLQVFCGRRALWVLGVSLVALGVGLEVAQGVLVPAIRQMDWHDAVANACGVLLGLAPARTRAATWLLRWEWHDGGARA